MSRLISKKDRPVSGTFSTSAISRPMPLRAAAPHANAARNDAHRHGHARSGSVATAGLPGQASSPQPTREHNATVTHATSHTSLSEWELVDDEDAHHRPSVHHPSRDNHHNTEHHVRHVGSLHRPTAKANSLARNVEEDDNLEESFEDIENQEWRSTIDSFDRQHVRMSTLFTDAEYGQEMLFNIFPELKGANKRTPLVPMPVWDKDIRASRLLASVMERQRQILKKLKSDVDADAIYQEELDKNIKRGLTISRASRHAAEKVMRIVDGLVAAKVEEINAIERRKAEYQERLRMTEGEVFPGSSRTRARPSGTTYLNVNVAR